MRIKYERQDDGTIRFYGHGIIDPEEVDIVNEMDDVPVIDKRDSEHQKVGEVVDTELKDDGLYATIELESGDLE